MAGVLVKQMLVIFMSCNIILNNVLVTSEQPPNAQSHCPDEGKAHHGHWTLEDKDGYRCILTCHHGYSPSECHIIRQDGYGAWNYNISTCETESWLSNKRATCMIAIVATIAASPFLLKALGFSAIGIAGGSFAATLMSYIGIVSKGSWFAFLQSLGMKGLSMKAYTTLMAGVGSACDGLLSFTTTGCEEE